jgi:hypothetical protein
VPEAGIPTKELCRNGGFSDTMFDKWRDRLDDLALMEALRTPVFYVGTLG